MNINTQLKLIEASELEKCYSNKYIELSKFISNRAKRVYRAIKIFNKAIAFKNYSKAIKVYNFINSFDNRLIDGKTKDNIDYRLKLKSILVLIRVLN